MTDISPTPLVVVLCLAAGLAVHALVQRLRRRQTSTLRSKLISFVLGLAGAEVASLPALVVAFVGEESTGWQDADRWLAVAAYVALNLFVVARLFPWREVEAMTAAPDASLRDIAKRLTAGDDDGNGRKR